MGFFDFLKGKNKKPESEEEKKEKVGLFEITPWIEKKEKEVEYKNRQILILLNDKRVAVIDSITQKLNVLENVDVDSKKAEDRMKFVVKENLSNYVYYVRDFLKKLLNLEMVGIEKFIANVDALLLELDKRSNLSYQKTNILVGKEITTIKEELKDFSKFLIDVINENKSYLDYSKTINTIRLQFYQLRKSEENISRIDAEIKEIDHRIRETKENQKELQEGIEKIKGTPEYEENARKQEGLELNRRGLEKEISNLKGLIDFKSLKSVFHVNEKRMRIIDAFKENFSAEFKRDNGEMLLSLLEEANLVNKKTSNTIEKIRKLEREIIKEKERMRGDGIQGLLEGISRMNYEVDNLVNEKIAEKKRQEKLSENNIKIIDLIKNELEKIEVVLTG
jgi:hypothetical protein